MQYLDFKKQIGFYAAYHQDPINQLVHVIFVPAIFCSALSLLNIYASATVALAAYLLYQLYYIVLAPVPALLFAPVLFALHYISVLIVNRSDALSTIGYIQLVSWVAQFASHAFAEGRAPSLFVSLPQSFLLAPFFVWMEVLWHFGYNPQQARQVRGKAKVDIAKWKATKVIKKAL